MALVDQFGKPLRADAGPDLRELGLPGTKLLAGLLYDEPNPALQGLRGLQTWQQMGFDPTIAMLLKVYELPLRSTRWRVEPADDSKQAADLADFCLPGDQTVLDSAGIPVRIDAVLPGDMVMTQKGRARVVTHRSERPFSGELISIRVDGYPHPIRLTPEHRVPTAGGWKQAGELQIGDELYRPRTFMAEGGDYDAGWVLGLFLAEGSVDKRRPTVVFTVHRKEVAHVVARINAFADRLGIDRRCRVHYAAKSMAAHVAINHAEFRSFIESRAAWEFGRRNGSRTMSLRKLPIQEQFARGIWDGWLYGDGSVGAMKVRDRVYRQTAGTTASMALGHQMQMIGGALGIPAAMSYRKPGWVTILGNTTATAGAYKVNAKPETVAAFKRTPELVAAARTCRADGLSYKKTADALGVSEMAAWAWLNQPPTDTPRAKGRQCRVEPQAVVHRVATVERVPFEGPVYDLRVEEDHTFCAGPIAVSNCHYNLWECGSQSFDDVLRMSIQGRNQYGFAAFETCWMAEQGGEYEGKWCWDKFAWRSQLTRYKWNVEEIDSPNGGRSRQLLSMTQHAPPFYQYIDLPRDKMLLFVRDLTGENFDGVPLLRACYKPWFIRDRLYTVQAVGLERSYMGIPKGKLPMGYTTAMQGLMKQIVEGVRTHERAGFVIREDMDVEMLFNKLEGRAMQDAIDSLTHLIPLSALAQFTLLGSGNVGSFALSSDQSELMLMALNAEANYTVEVFNLDPIIPRLIGFNFPNVSQDLMPRMEHGEVGERNLEKLGRTLGGLLQWGAITPDDGMEDALREQLGLPERDATVTPEYLRTLIEEVSPDKEMGQLHPAQRLPIPGATNPAAQGAGQVPFQQAAPAASAKFAEARARMPWPRPDSVGGRVSSEHRVSIMAAERLMEFIEGTKPSGKPERPSVRLAKRRKAYRIRTDVAPPKPQTVAMADAKIIPRHQLVVQRHKKALKDFLLARGTGSGHKTVPVPAGAIFAEPDAGNVAVPSVIGAVNMAADAIDQHHKTPESKRYGTEVGRKAGKRTATILRKRPGDRTVADQAHLDRTNAYIDRQKAKRPATVTEGSAYRHSLMNWGHDPLR